MSKFKKIIQILFEKEKKEEFSPIGKSYKKKEIEYLTVTEIAKHFKIEASELNNIFSNLQWAIKEGRWWIATEKGLALGAKQEYNTRNKVKYIKWNKEIKGNFELKKINQLKNITI